MVAMNHSFFIQHLTKVACILIVLLLPMQLPAGDIKNGGLLIYAEKNGEKYLLLANHKKNKKKWGGLGGRFDPKWDKSSLDAAIRETSEETFCFITEAAFLTDPSSPMSIHESDFVTYVVQVPYVASEKIENRNRRESFCKDKKITNEREQFRWVKWSDLKQELAHFENVNEMLLNGVKSSKELQAVHVNLPGQGNYYRAAYVRTLYEFLEGVNNGQYQGWE